MNVLFRQLPRGAPIGGGRNAPRQSIKHLRERYGRLVPAILATRVTCAVEAGSPDTPGDHPRRKRQPFTQLPSRFHSVDRRKGNSEALACIASVEGTLAA